MNQPAPSTPPANASAPDAAASGAKGGRHKAPKDSGTRNSFFTELPVLILIAFVLALVLKTFLVQAFFIPSSSMEPTLDIGDRVLVNKLSYRLREPRRGEIVVFTEHDESIPDDRTVGERLIGFLSSGLGVAQPGERDFIKRIIGLPGETIEMRDGVVLIDGEPLPEAPNTEGGYLSERDLNDFGAVEVPEGHYFMMGDNRPNSADSRFSLGPIQREGLVGRAFVVIWPLPRADILPIAEYDEEAAEAVDAGEPVQPAAVERVPAAATVAP